MSDQLHQRKRSVLSLSDEWETPTELYMELCINYKINPEVDIAADIKSTKCAEFVDKKQNALERPWTYLSGNSIGYADIWCNPPHSLTKEFVLKADEQWRWHNISIMMIIPANSCTTKYLEKVYDNIEIHPIFGRITFLIDGKKSPYPARNGYFVVIWRKK